MLDKIREIKYGFRKEEPEYLALLALALTLPDICGKIEFPHEKVGKRYSLWFDKYVYEDFFKPQPSLHDDPDYLEVLENVKFDGDFCYALRCTYLHSGDLNVSPKANKVRCLRLSKIEVAEDNRVMYYGLLPEETNPEKRYEIEISIKYLCQALAKGALDYYNSKEPKAESLFAEHEINLMEPRHLLTGKPVKSMEQYREEGAQLVKGCWLRKENKIALLLPDQYVRK